MYFLRDQKEIAERLAEIMLNNLLYRGEKIRNPRLILVATQDSQNEDKKKGGIKNGCEFRE
jgi:hypothetical protein